MLFYSWASDQNLDEVSASVGAHSDLRGKKLLDEAELLVPGRKKLWRRFTQQLSGDLTSVIKTCARTRL
jgi:hypothetical protein